MVNNSETSLESPPLERDVGVRNTTSDKEEHGLSSAEQPTRDEARQNISRKQSKSSQNVNPPPSIFTQNEKWFIVGLASLSGALSPFTSNIYLPAIPTIAEAFHQPVEAINLTVTVFLVFQGASPVLWGPLSDIHGRRPLTLVCLTILIGSSVGLALVSTNAYWLLLVLRCLQSAGSASTVALSAGIVSDITTRAERGGFFGISILGPMIGPAIGPVVGGALSQHFGWRAIFWFICISTGVCLAVAIMPVILNVLTNLLIMILSVRLLPETLRSIVGNGSIPVSRFRRPLIPLIGRNCIQDPSKSTTLERPPRKKKENVFRLLISPELLLLFGFNGLVCAEYYAVITTISTYFESNYPFLSQTDVGLCFLASGGGCAVASYVTGRWLNKDYASVRKKFGASTSREEKRVDDDDFPIEYARLRNIPPFLIGFCGACLGYGWCIDKKTQLAGPLALQFVIGYTFIAIMVSTQTLSLDLYPTQGSSVSAVNNLIRCLLSAAATSVIEIMIKGINAGWSFTILSVICLAAYALCYLEMKVGPRWRKRRLKRARDAGNSNEKRNDR